jgi:transposase
MNEKSVKKINLFIMLDCKSNYLTNIIKRLIMKKHTPKTNSMERINPNTAGIDIGAQSIFVCAGFNDGRQVVREFLTFTADLRAAATWLKECGIKSIAMESTGSYWISTYELMEEVGLEVLLVNAHHLKAVPGKKTDVKDCQWIQQLHSYGLLRGSFRPDSNGVTFRAYVRQRSKLIDLASTQVQLMNKALVQMNIRLDQVFSQIAGASSLAIMRSIVVGERDPKTLAKHRDIRCKRTTGDVIKALEGNFRPEHIFSLKQALNSYDFIHAQISECDTEIKNILDNWYVEQEKTLSSMLNNESKNNPLKSKKKKSYKKNSYSFNAAPYLEKIKIGRASCRERV